MGSRRKGTRGRAGKRAGPSAGSRRLAVWLLGGAALLLLAAVVYSMIHLFHIFNADVTTSTVNVPAIDGLKEPDAQAALKKAQLDPHRVREDYNDKVATGIVFGQDPAVGQMVRPGRQVRYYVSLGRATFTVPDLSGLSLDAAEALLRKSGLRLGEVLRIIDRSHPAGKIVNQNPRLGEERSIPVAVDVFVADSHELPQVAMPDLAGQPLSAVEDLLTTPDLNLQLAVVEYVGDDAAAPGTVTGQKPAAKSMAQMGSKVELQVAMPTALKAAPRKRLTLSIPVPNGPPAQLVRITVADDLDDHKERTDYKEMKKPGDRVERTVDVEGAAVVRVYVGDDKNPLREERI